MAKVYKSRKSIMPSGVLAIALAVSLVGCLLSFVYLKLCDICPSVYLCILLAIGFGAGLGVISKLLIKALKIHSVSSALLGVLIGCLVFTVFKWALYVTWDDEKIYDSIKDKSAFEYCEFDYDFLNSNNELPSDERIQLAVNYLKETSVYDYYQSFYEGGADQWIADMRDYYKSDFAYSASELKEMKAFDYFYKGYVIEGKEVESIKTAYKMNAKDYFLDYLGKGSTVTSLITHPKVFFEKIKDINDYGRWSISSRPTYAPNNTNNTQKNNNVKGWMLWIVWIGEIFLICAPTFAMAKSRAELPFIESENVWAIKNASDGFILRAPIQSKGVGQAFINNPDSLFAYDHIFVRPGQSEHLSIELYHSKFYDENYISLFSTTIVQASKLAKPQQRKVCLAKYVYVDKNFVTKFFLHCQQDPPYTYTPEMYAKPVANESEPEKNDPMDIFNQPIPELKKPSPKTDFMPGEMDSVSIEDLKADEKSSEDIYNELNS